MSNEEETSRSYSPTMTQDYSQISDTAVAVEAKIWPRISAYIQSIAPQIADLNIDAPFVIADYGSADGVNSSKLFENIISQIRAINPSLKIRLVYIDLADQAFFEKFWSTSKLAKLKDVEAQYIRRSFYERFPEIERRLWIGFSSTALHWLNAKTVALDFFQHPSCIQPNQLQDAERKIFIEKWESDWRLFLHECSVSLVTGGALFFANLTNLGGDEWPASAGYNYLRDICRELQAENKISQNNLNVLFIPDYFATPQEMTSLLTENYIKNFFILRACDPLTVPCAYYTKFENKSNDPQARAEIASTLARVVRAWSESSIRTGLPSDRQDIIEEIYQRLREKFHTAPKGLPYQYCLIELIKKESPG